MDRSEAESAAADGLCFHCGLPLPAGTRFFAVIDGARRAMCCAGCQAVAQAISAGGFEAYYRDRTALPPAAEVEDAADDLAIYDLPEVQRGLVRAFSGALEADLLLQGITCAACIWLNEQHVAKLPGVLAMHVNYTSHRACVRWDPQRIRLSDILRAIRAIGYRAFPVTDATAQAARKREDRALLWRLFVAGFGMMQVMMYALPAYLAEDGSMSADIARLMRIASLVLTVPVVLFSCGPFFRGAWRDLKLRRLGMDVPIAVGIGVAFAASVYATLSGGGAVYFDSITMFVFFLLSGRYLEQRARHKAAMSLEYLDRAIPLAAHRLVSYPASRATEEVAAVTLQPGDLVLVKPGEAIPADGVLVDGETETDEALLTGESRPVVKRAGAGLAAGAVNRLNPAVMRVQRAGEATRASHIRRLTERAAAQRPHVVEMADRIAGWFVAAVLAVAAVTALYWAVTDAARALWTAVAVLVVTCPCALSLATPTALAAAVGNLARRGVIVTRGHAIEALAQVTHVVFDKTGTLTRGQLSLEGLEVLADCTRAQALAMAAALEQGSEHPIATTIRSVAAQQGAQISVAEAVRTVAGAGVEGCIGGVCYRIGTVPFVAALAGTPAPERQLADMTPVWLGCERGWLALFTFTDALRPEAAQVIAALQTAGKRVLILSGDESAAVRGVAARLGVASAEGGLLPEEKHARVRMLQDQGAVVAMVGDGVNDAPVLAQAQVSIAMGSGAVLSQAHSDLVLLDGRLGRLLDAFAVSARTMRIVRENLLWAVAYNVIALPLAVAGYVTPWLAGIGMGMSSLLVVLNALRLVHTKSGRGVARQATDLPAPEPSFPAGR